MRWLIALVALLALAACERTASDPPRPIAHELFRGLPDGQAIVFAVHHVKTSSDTAMMPCLSAGREVRLAGGIAMQLPRIVLRAVIEDSSLVNLVPCARKAKLGITTDDAGKRAHLSIAMPGGVAMLAELVQLPGDRVLVRLDIDVEAAPYFQHISPADIDADVAALAKRTSADDSKLMTLLDRVDGRRPVTYAGDGARVPVANTLGEVYGSADISSDELAVDVTAQILDADLADRFERRAKDVQSQHVMSELAVSRNGDRIHVVGRASFAQMRALQQIINAR